MTDNLFKEYLTIFEALQKQRKEDQMAARKKDDPKELYRLGDKMVEKAEAIKNIAGELRDLEKLTLDRLAVMPSRITLAENVVALKADPHQLPGYAEKRNKALRQIVEIIKETEREHLLLLYQHMQKLGSEI